MRAGTKRRSPTWQQSLLLVIFGGFVGYSCFENLDIWGNGRQHQALYGLGFFAGIVAFISGLVSFFAIAVKAVASPAGSGSAIAARSPAMPRVRNADNAGPQRIGSESRENPDNETGRNTD